MYLRKMPLSHFSKSLICSIISISFLTSGPSFSQDYGRGPTLLTIPSQDFGANSYQIDGASTCPTASVGLSGFGTGGNDWANAHEPYNYANSGINNFGVAGGVRIPLGGQLSDFCKQYAKAKADFQRVRVENKKRDSQLQLIKQCDYLMQYHWNLDDPGFEDPAFSSLLPCRKIKLARKPDRGEMKDPPISSTEEKFSPDVPVIIERKEFIDRNFR